jgi:hypothetical protein
VYESTIHWSSLVLAPSWFTMLGIATLRIELSTTMTSRLTLRTSRISQRRL